MFGVPGFAGLWVSAAAGSFARIVVQLVLSWITFESTGDPFMVGVVLAMRMVPQFLLGIPAGVLSDSVSRRALIAVASGAIVLTALAAAAAAVPGPLSLPAILLASVTFGSLDTLRTAATQTYVHDLVRDVRVTRGIALTNFGAQLFGALGGLLGGYALWAAGTSASFGLVALAALIGAIGPLLGQSTAVQAPTVVRSRPDIWKALTLLGRSRTVAILSGVIVLAEIFGFSHLTLLPTFARDIFDVGEAGFGALTAARSAGGVISLLLLAGLGTGERTGRVFLSTGGALGLALVAFAAAPSFALALLLLALAGAAASAHDTLGQTLLLRSVGERERGAAMGIWVFSIGCAPLGHLTLGAAAGMLGAPPAQALSGAAMVLVALSLATYGPLRRAR